MAGSGTSSGQNQVPKVKASYRQKQRASEVAPTRFTARGDLCPLPQLYTSYLGDRDEVTLLVLLWSRML